MRLLLFVPLALLLAFADAALRDAAGAEAPELLLLLALHAGIAAGRDDAAAHLWLAGMIRDFTLGPRLGVSALCFLALASVSLFLRERLRRDHPAPLLLLAFAAAFSLRLFDALALDPALAWSLRGELLRSAAVAAAYTTALALPVRYLLKLLPLVPAGRAEDALFREGGA